MNRLSASIVFLGLAVLMGAVYVFGGAGGKKWPADYRAEAALKLPAREFPFCCPEPVWWAEVEAQRKIETLEDFQIVWWDKKMPKREQGKAIFQAIHDHVYDDDGFAATLINSFYYTDRDYPYLTALLEYGVDRYFDYDRSLEHYSGKKGDAAAGLVTKLAMEYNRAGRFEDAARLLIAFITAREAEVNQHLLETASLHLAEALDKSGRSEEAYKVIDYAIRRYEGGWEEKLIEARADIKRHLGVKYYLIGFFNTGAVLFFRRA